MAQEVTVNAVKVDKVDIKALNEKKSALIVQRNLEIARINALPAAAKSTTQAVIPLPKLGTENLISKTVWDTMNNKEQIKFLVGLVKRGIKISQQLIDAEKLVSDAKVAAKTKVANTEYAKYNELTAVIKKIAKVVLDAELGNKPTGSGRVSSGNSEPITPEKKAKMIRKYFDQISPAARKKYNIQLTSNGLTASFMKAGTFYPIEVQRTMVRAKLFPDTASALIELRKP